MASSLPWAVRKFYRGMEASQDEGHRGIVPLSLRDVKLSTWLICWQWPWSPDWGNVYQAPPLWGYSPPFPHPRMNYISWSSSNYINYPKFFYMGDVSIPSHLFIYSSFSISLDSRIFILCFALQSNIPLFCCSNCSALVIENSFVGSCVPLTSSCFLFYVF